jgi:hypothetical protein
MKTVCEICGCGQNVPKYDDWTCKDCGQKYEYNECHRIILTDKQKAVLCKCGDDVRRQMNFKLISTDRDGRIIRQMFAAELDLGCLILVSTTIYHDVTYAAESGKYDSVGQLPIEDLIATVPIDKIEESLAYVPGMKLGQKGKRRVL